MPLQRFALLLISAAISVCGCYSADKLDPEDIPELVDYGPSPSWILEDLESNNHDSNELYGFVVLYFFLDVNCSTCPLDFDELEELKAGISDQDFKLVLVGDAATPDQIAQYLEIHDYSADLNLVDRSGDVISDFTARITGWSDPGYPFLILKDRDDRLRYGFEGSIKQGGMRSILDVLIRDLLGE